MAKKTYDMGTDGSVNAENGESKSKSYIAERANRSKIADCIGDVVAFDSFGRIGDTGDYKLVYDTNEKHVVCFFNPVTKQMKIKEYKV
jgi:hypothetical protein